MYAHTPHYISLGEEKMSILSDALELISREEVQHALTEKYRIMLKRNNSIVKDTLSKIWKLCSILSTNMQIHETIENSLPSTALPGDLLPIDSMEQIER